MTYATPRIYVACLASYNAGRLHGAWIEATSNIEELQDAIKAMLKNSPCPDAEEYAFHDYDDFPNLGEYPGPQEIADLAQAIEQAESDHSINPDDFKAICENWHGNIDDIRNALDNFAGIFETLRDFADTLADDILESEGTLEGSFAQRYFDYESHARDVDIEYTVIDCPSGVAAFYPH